MILLSKSFWLYQPNPTILKCLSVVIWERINRMLGSNPNTWIEVKAGWLVSPPWRERAGYQCSSLTPWSWHLSWRARSVALPPVWSVPPVWAEYTDRYLQSGYAVKWSKRRKKKVNSYTNEKSGKTWLMFFMILKTGGWAKIKILYHFVYISGKSKLKYFF